MDNILEVRGLKMHFGGVKAVDELSFDVHRHELLGVIGPNGSGKTTMFNALTGVYKPTDGKVTFNGIDITGKPLDSMVNYGIARTFQNLRVFKAMTVLDNIMIGNSKNIHTNLFDAALHTPRYRKYEKESLEKARELLSLLGLSRWENEYVGSIPYGIQKRIEFARAVIVEPQLLLLDEPAAGLNSKEAEDLMQMILWVKDKKGFTVILIDHNMKIICEAIRQGATRENLADWIMNRIPGQSFVMENNMLLGPRVTWADNGNVDSFVSSVIRVDENGDFVPFGDVDTTGLS